ncbi:MAG: polyprenyl synthetase family protein [Gammaproteobacteria bacterium]|nr:polyprenyl synthetase family protein [Pseudomonadales bacterium]MCP5348666.1 polyprenyl synthetase family protein [Pseudomonadales bacterium]
MTTATPARFDSLESFITHIQQRVENGLGELLTGQHDFGHLQQAMAYASLNGGKRVRPVLVYGAALAAGANLERADTPALAVELIHCYSLVHDDLPAMDDDDLRRGKPTVHKAYDEATAILTGDSLLTLAFEVLAQAGPATLSADRRLNMVASLARAAGAQGMVAGQVLDFEAAGTALDLEQLKAMHALKTGALIAASVELGALAGPVLQAGKHSALRHYAECVGLAFQIQDDVLDVVSDTAILGKPQGSDQSRNKPTYTSLLGLEAARDQARALADQGIDALADFGGEADMLRRLARYIVERVH